MRSQRNEGPVDRRTVSKNSRDRLDNPALRNWHTSQDIAERTTGREPTINYAPSQPLPHLDQTHAPKAGIRSRLPFLFLLLLPGVLYLGTAASPALLDDDVDAAHALVAREILQRHDFVVMYMNGIRYLIRPPLHFWLVAASYAVLGESAFATRLPVALAMIGLVLLVYKFGRRFLCERTGIYAALVAATSAGTFIFTRVMLPEALYAMVQYPRRETGVGSKRLSRWK